MVRGLKRRSTCIQFEHHIDLGRDRLKNTVVKRSPMGLLRVSTLRFSTPLAPIWLTRSFSKTVSSRILGFRSSCLLLLHSPCSPVHGHRSNPITVYQPHPVHALLMALFVCSFLSDVLICLSQNFTVVAAGGRNAQSFGNHSDT